HFHIATINAASGMLIPQPNAILSDLERPLPPLPPPPPGLLLLLLLELVGDDVVGLDEVERVSEGDEVD
ncbi:MAG: hypothetical protein M1839_006123, partial [Geoglossum umbratile]